MTWVKQWNSWKMSCDVGEATEGLENETLTLVIASRINPRKLPKGTTLSAFCADWILQTFRCFTNVTAHSPTLPSLYPYHGSFSYPSVTSPTSQLILQLFRCFTHVTAHSPTLPSLHLSHISFSNPSVALPTSQLILQLFRCFTYVTAHSRTLLSLLLRHTLQPWRYG